MLANSGINIIVHNDRFEGPLAEAMKGMELEAVFSKKNVHISEHRLTSVEFDKFNFGLDKENARKVAQGILENSQFATLYVDFYKIHVFDFSYVIQPCRFHRMRGNGRHKLRQIVKFTEQRGIWFKKRTRKNPIRLMKDRRFPITDKVWIETVRLAIFPIQPFTLLWVGLEADDPRPPNIHQ